MNAIDEFLKEPTNDYYIKCSNIRDRDAKRSGLFHARRKYSSTIQDIVGIKNKDIGDDKYVVLYSRIQEEHYRMINGELVPVKGTEPAGFETDNSRMIELMKKDGYSDEDIAEHFRSCKEEMKNAN